MWEDFKDALEHAAEAMRGQYDASITLIAGRPFDLLELIRLGKVEGDDEKVSPSGSNVLSPSVCRC